MTPLTPWSELGGLLFVARRLVEGMYAGRHASPLRGQGIEFHDYRLYSPGDDPARVDWKLLGRTDRYYVRLNRQYTNLTAHLLVDQSASMDFAGLDGGRDQAGNPRPTKLRYAATLAAAIAFLAVRQADRVGLALFAQQVSGHAAPSGTWAHLQRVCALLEQAQPIPGRGDVGASLAQVLTLASGRGDLLCRSSSHTRGGLLVVISDLLDDPAGVLDAIARFRHQRFECVVFQVLTPDELDLSGTRDHPRRFVDPETLASTPSRPSQIQRRYRELVQDHLATVRRGCLALETDHNLLTTDQPIAHALRRYLANRG